MKFLEYKLFSGGFINRFLTAGVFTKENPVPENGSSG